MSKLRIEWVVLASAIHTENPAMIIAKQIGDAVELDSPQYATAPAGPTHVRIVAVSGDSIVHLSDLPDASQTNGLLYMESAVDVRPVKQGDVISFVERT